MYLACGYTDLSRGIDGLATIVEQQFQLDPCTDTLFLFCGRRTDRIKALYWEGDGSLLLYKRLEKGRFQWPRNENEALSITPQQYRYNTDDFRLWAKSIGNSAERFVDYFLKCGSSQEQGYKSCVALMKYGEKYGKEKLKRTCKRMLEISTVPSIRTIAIILKTARSLKEKHLRRLTVKNSKKRVTLTRSLFCFGWASEPDLSVNELFLDCGFALAQVQLKERRQCGSAGGEGAVQTPCSCGSRSGIHNVHIIIVFSFFDT